ncbi:hypothetical protein BOTBODRAFT_37989 [Botryobasidium botryosum FD-172 SS1]|uniref:Uncharacterized protein n=1 Tax=Botryobasidium botryosum (strain FD-172 SS1) TaxID=930990 RepID=A0A067MA11_BOTB1|nr:hypothetical protein BOTBODRAFT_37989 [Botryobasidium botryosum FD-172 SS1]
MHFPTIAIAALMASGASAYRMTLWSGTSYTGQAVAYTSSGSHSLGFSANSYKWESTVGDGCCAVFCYKSMPPKATISPRTRI